MKAIVVTDQAAGTAGMKLVERPEPQAALNDVVVPARSVGHGLGTQRKRQPNRDALTRRAAIHRPLFGDGHALLVR